jgi:hypothetical protein
MPAQQINPIAIGKTHKDIISIVFVLCSLFFALCSKKNNQMKPS